MLQDKHFYFIKLSLALLYLRKQLKFLHLSLWITSVRLSARFDNKVVISFALSVNFILQDIITTFITIFINFCNFFFYWNWKFFVLFCVFAKIFRFFFNLICEFFYDKMIIIIRTVMKNYRNLIGHIKV